MNTNKEPDWVEVAPEKSTKGNTLRLLLACISCLIIIAGIVLVVKAVH